jgi:hypothetical protein
MRGICRCGMLAVILMSSACHSGPSLSVGNLEFLTRPDCVNTPTMRERLDEALGRLSLATNYRVTDLAMLPAADPRRGYPTPTVLYRHHDLFGMPAPHPPYAEPT